MKKRFWLSVALLVTIVVNFIFSYLLINTQAFNSLYQEYVEMPRTDVNLGQVQVDQPYFKTHQPTLSELVSPYQIIVNEAGHYYHAYQAQILDDLRNQALGSFIELKDNQPSIDPIRLDEILNEDHVQFLFLTKLSLSLMENWVEVPDQLATKFQINRVVVSLKDKGHVYLVDSLNKAYLEGELKKTFDQHAFMETIQIGIQDRIEMLAYEVNRDTVYLPKESLATPSQVFSLEKVPENYFIEPVFEDRNFDITQPDVNNVRSYHTFNSSLMIDDDTNILSVNHHNNQSNNFRREEIPLVNQDDLLRKGLEIANQFNYWEEDLRLFMQNGNQMVFRRFFAGLPIFPQPTISDYGASKLSFSVVNKQVKLEKLQMPLMILGVNVSDLSKPQLVESGQEIADLLEEQNLKFTKFNKIILGFEWQKEMEDFKKVKLVPKWFFVVGNQIYSIDQLKDGSLRLMLQQRASNSVD